MDISRNFAAVIVAINNARNSLGALEQFALPQMADEVKNLMDVSITRNVNHELTGSVGTVTPAFAAAEPRDVKINVALVKLPG
ncbi:hypothetical protein BTJ39_11725 [Izhakiella australiensis]|uniref:Uncharacterized protein n=1 Tax=Izhakiella australiensis TaxID=1926881 RepID=A0A1S8YL87_9GAMM|nr:hypothetical protein [Izhakiella australiensis]OON39702.1 hypothetical protein BTJ39_11725 [Izhakiella australiensis]